MGKASMAHEADKDLAFLASISGKFDMVEHLQHKAQDVKEAWKVELKEGHIYLIFHVFFTNH